MFLHSESNKLSQKNMTKEQQTEYMINFIIDEMTKYLMTDYNLDMPTALNIIYNSQAMKLLQNKETELYSQSPGYVYAILQREYTTGKIG